MPPALCLTQTEASALRLGTLPYQPELTVFNFYATAQRITGVKTTCSKAKKRLKLTVPVTNMCEKSVYQRLLIVEALTMTEL